MFTVPGLDVHDKLFVIQNLISTVMPYRIRTCPDSFVSNMHRTLILKVYTHISITYIYVYIFICIYIYVYIVYIYIYVYVYMYI